MRFSVTFKCRHNEIVTKKVTSNKEIVISEARQIASDTLCNDCQFDADKENYGLTEARKLASKRE